MVATIPVIIVGLMFGATHAVTIGDTGAVIIVDTVKPMMGITVDTQARITRAMVLGWETSLTAFSARLHRRPAFAAGGFATNQ
jgi:hypothetical protein